MCEEEEKREEERGVWKTERLQSITSFENKYTVLLAWNGKLDAVPNWRYSCFERFSPQLTRIYSIRWDCWRDWRGAFISHLVYSPCWRVWKVEWKTFWAGLVGHLSDHSYDGRLWADLGGHNTSSTILKSRTPITSVPQRIEDILFVVSHRQPLVHLTIVCTMFVYRVLPLIPTKSVCCLWVAFSGSSPL